MRSFLAVLLLGSAFASHDENSAALAEVADRADKAQHYMCSINGPDTSGLSWTFGVGEKSQSQCAHTCVSTVHSPPKISSAYSSYFTAACMDRDGGHACHQKGSSCHCMDKEGRDMLPPHGLMNKCGEADCWDYYLAVMFKVEKKSPTNFWTPSSTCAACGEDGQSECDSVNIPESFGVDELMKLKDGSKQDQERFNLIKEALVKNGFKVDSFKVETRRAAWTTEVMENLKSDRYTGEGMPDVSEQAWRACNRKCLESSDTTDPKQTRDIKCVVEAGPRGSGKWSYESDVVCSKLIPKSEKPQLERTCEPQLQPCFKWARQCLDHEGVAVDEKKCEGLSM